MRSFAKITPSRNFPNLQYHITRAKHTHSRTHTNNRFNDPLSLTLVVGLVVLKFLLNESMGANDPLGVATLDPRDMVGR